MIYYLCNVTYKIIAKVIANFLKRNLPHLIDESQNGFDLGRLITDNSINAFEAFRIQVYGH